MIKINIQYSLSVRPTCPNTHYKPDTNTINIA